MTLQELIQSLSDFRRLQGLRANKEQMLWLILLGGCCGYFGGRRLSRFGKAYAEILTVELQLKYPPPSHVTFSKFLNNIDCQEFINKFNAWATSNISLEKGEFISGDGKALASTLEKTHSSEQNHKAIVSLFCQKTGLVYAIEKHENPKDSEISVVRELIKLLKDQGVVFFGDALHTQKKQLTK